MRRGDRCAWLAALVLCGCSGAEWPGRYDGTFEGAYATTRPGEDGKTLLARSTFAGEAWLAVEPVDDDVAAVRVTDCVLAFAVDGTEGTLRTDQAPDDCLLDVGGSVGVLAVRPMAGRAVLEDDRLRLEYSGAAHGGQTASFRFTGKRSR